MKGRAAAPEAAAVKATAAAEAAATATAEAAAATAAEASTAAGIGASHFDHHSFGSIFGCRHEARTSQRQRLGALLCRGRQRQHGGSRQSRTADKSPRGT